jgi:hypothetical protein
MDVTHSQHGSGSKPAHAVLPQESGSRRMDQTASAGAPVESPSKPSGYGLPCAKCRLYYAADLDICPTCHHRGRVLPVVPAATPKVTQSAADAAPTVAVVEQEREEFLRLFKSQLIEAHAESGSPSAAMCSLGEHHAGEAVKAEVCKPCYDRLQEKLDVCEAALHMDLAEAAQVIYDAVWSDPSDPSKTYQNAANALLIELRKRGGMASVRGPFHPLSD